MNKTSFTDIIHPESFAAHSFYLYCRETYNYLFAMLIKLSNHNLEQTSHYSSPSEDVPGNNGAI